MSFVMDLVYFYGLTNYLLSDLHTLKAEPEEVLLSSFHGELPPPCTFVLFHTKVSFYNKFNI